MSRYNIFFPVHKGLRALLCDTTQLLQQTNFMVEDEASNVIAQIEVVVNLFESHAHKEDNFVFTAIHAYEPSVVANFEAEHEEDHALGQSLQHWIKAFQYAVAPSAKQSIGEELTKAFVEFMVFNLRHMAKEEQVISPILWQYYSDDELHEITLRIMKAIPQQELAFFSRWMVRGLNNAEIIHWLKGVKNTAPQPAFEALLSIAESEVQPHRWSFVQESLTDGALVA